MTNNIENASYKASRRWVYAATLVAIVALFILPFLL